MKPKVYLILDSQIKNPTNFSGRIIDEGGKEIGEHTSSTLNFLRVDLKHKLDNPDDYEIIDLIREPVIPNILPIEIGERKIRVNIAYTRNLGNYESCKVELGTERTLADSEDKEEALDTEFGFLLGMALQASDDAAKEIIQNKESK